MRIALLLGHSSTDPGAVSGSLRERDLAGRYMMAAATELRALGVEVLTDATDRPYSERLSIARSKGASLIVWCHANAGGGGYGLVMLDALSPVGSLSRRWADAYRRAQDGLFPLAPVRIDDVHAGDRGAVLFRSPLPVAVLEPFFIDCPGHIEQLPRGLLLRVAAAVVTATMEVLCP